MDDRWRRQPPWRLGWLSQKCGFADQGLAVKLANQAKRLRDWQSQSGGGQHVATGRWLPSGRAGRASSTATFLAFGARAGPRGHRGPTKSISLQIRSRRRRRRELQRRSLLGLRSRGHKKEADDENGGFPVLQYSDVWDYVYLSCCEI